MDTDQDLLELALLAFLELTLPILGLCVKFLEFGFDSIQFICRWTYYGFLGTGGLILGAILATFAIVFSPILLPMGIIFGIYYYYYEANPRFEDMRRVAGKERRGHVGIAEPFITRAFEEYLSYEPEPEYYVPDPITLAFDEYPNYVPDPAYYGYLENW